MSALTQMMECAYYCSRLLTKPTAFTNSLRKFLFSLFELTDANESPIDAKRGQVFHAFLSDYNSPQNLIGQSDHT